MAPLLEATGLRAGYGSIPVLRDVSLEVNAGEVVALIGANGAGKTTLMRTLIGVLPARAGEIRLRGRDVTHSSTTERVRAGMSLVPEGREVFPTLSVEKNLRLGAYPLHTRSRRLVRNRLADVFELFPALEELRKQIAGALSGGEQQMLAIGRALMAGPSMLLIDELSLGLAPLVVRELYPELVDAAIKREISILVVEQNVDLALRIATRAYVMASGQVVLEGATAALRTDSRVERLYMRGRLEPAPSGGAAR